MAVRDAYARWRANFPITDDTDEALDAWCARDSRLMRGVLAERPRDDVEMAMAFSVVVRAPDYILEAHVPRLIEMAQSILEQSQDHQEG